MKEPIIGKYILDSLSIGMYNDPMMVIREYIQNSTDAIDQMEEECGSKGINARIDITIDGKAREIAIRDNGNGINGSRAWRILHSIGVSDKKIGYHRGFRGIGRLGGLGYCDNLIFISKSKGENTYHYSEWDCKKLNKLIIDASESNSLNDVLRSIVKYEECKYEGDIDKHFFEVRMLNVKSSRNILLNIPKVRAYVSQVAPVPFNRDRFSYSDEIENKLKNDIHKYNTYNIYINGEKIFKPHTDVISIGKERKDRISAIEYKYLKRGNDIIGLCWIGRNQLLGAINGTSMVDGIRVRCNNILIGDKNLLDEFFREKRFNSYIVGELHAINKGLIPNSRRDDFEDSELRDDMLDAFVKEIGIPCSRIIREQSKNRNIGEKPENNGSRLITEINQILKYGYIAEKQKRTILSEIKKLQANNDIMHLGKYKKTNDIYKDIISSKHLLDSLPKNFRFSKEKMRYLYEVAFCQFEDKEKAKVLLHKLYYKLNEKYTKV